MEEKDEDEKKRKEASMESRISTSTRTQDEKHVQDKIEMKEYKESRNLIERIQSQELYKVPEGYYTSEDIMNVGPLSYTEMMQQILSGSTFEETRTTDHQKAGVGAFSEVEKYYQNSMVITTNRVEMTSTQTRTSQNDTIQPKGTSDGENMTET
ncbi:hypothetical protein ACP4OV_015336 [Aristida adscensionis]